MEAEITLSIPFGFNGQLLYFCTAHSSIRKNLLFSNASPVISSGDNALSLTLTEDSSLSYDLNATDADGDTLSWSLSTAPSNGNSTIDSVDGILSYTPTANYNGSDSLVVQVSDGALIDSVTFNFSIGAESDAPTILDLNATLSLSLTEDSFLLYDLNASDADGDTLSWSLSTIPSNGTATVDSVTGVLTYTPTANYNGSDSLVVQVSDGSLIDSVTVNFSIGSENDAPTILDLNTTLSLSLLEDSTLSYDLNASDADVDTLSWSLPTIPSNGTATVDSVTGVLTYTPTANYNGVTAWWFR